MNYNTKTDDELIAIIRNTPHETGNVIDLRRYPPYIVAEARNALVSRFFETAEYEAKSYPIHGVDIEDRAAECRLAMVKAIDSYDPTKRVKVKTYVKLLMRNALTELYRAATRKGEVPNSKLLPLDLGPNAGSDDLDLSDVTGSGEDVEADALSRLHASDQRDNLAWGQWLALNDAMEGIETANAERLVASVTAFSAATQSADDHASLLELIAGASDQMQLFSLAPTPRSGAAHELARTVFEGYAALQGWILQDMAEGYDQEEIATRLTFRMQDAHPGMIVRPQTVAAVVAALRAQAGEPEEVVA